MDNGRDWRDVSGNQGMPQLAENHQKLERGKVGFYLESQGEQGPAETLISEI